MGDDDVKVAFDLFDQDKDGIVSKSELLEIFKKLGGQIKPAAVEAFIKKVDKDNSGSIDYNEFINLWDILKNSKKQFGEMKDIREQFEELDVDGSGYISKEDLLKNIAGSVPEGTEEEEVKNYLDELDVDGDGRISFPEFLLNWKFKN